MAAGEVPRVLGDAPGSFSILDLEGLAGASRARLWAAFV
jgi:hypothetical protein